MPQWTWKIPCATSITWHSQINKNPEACVRLGQSHITVFPFPIMLVAGPGCDRLIGWLCSSCFTIQPVQFSRSVVSDSLWPHEPQHTRPPCPSPTPRVYPNSCPSGRWCHPTISSSVIPFSSCPQSFSASGSFQMSQLFMSGGQSIVLTVTSQLVHRNRQVFTPFSGP